MPARVLRASEFSQRPPFSGRNSLIAESRLDAGCITLYSEDMQDATIHPPVLGSGGGLGGRDRLREGTRSRASRDGFTACLALPARSREDGVNRYMQHGQGIDRRLTIRNPFVCRP